MNESAGMETRVADLSGLTLDQLKDSDWERLAPVLAYTLRQVQRPRINMGDSGPPGRAD